MPHRLATPVINTSVRVLCTRPYPGHPHGCPNFNRRDTCPPKAPLLEELLDLDQPVYAVWNCFNLRQHAARMQHLHPQWSDRQVYCCLYWQPTARKLLRGQLQVLLRKHKYLLVVPCPEGAGVDVTATMASRKIHLQWPPRTFAYQVALAGTCNPLQEGV